MPYVWLGRRSRERTNMCLCGHTGPTTRLHKLVNPKPGAGPDLRTPIQPGFYTGALNGQSNSLKLAQSSLVLAAGTACNARHFSVFSSLKKTNKLRGPGPRLAISCLRPARGYALHLQATSYSVLRRQVAPAT